ncbi:MAG: helix-turn-helix domain-containing protein [Fuerstiella sp.]
MGNPKPAIPKHGFATIPQAGDFLQVGRTTVYAMLKDGSLPSAQIRNARRIPCAALHRLADDAVQSSTPQ